MGPDAVGAAHRARAGALRGRWLARFPPGTTPSPVLQGYAYVPESLGQLTWLRQLR